MVVARSLIRSYLVLKHDHSKEKMKIFGDGLDKDSRSSRDVESAGL